MKNKYIFVFTMLVVIFVVSMVMTACYVSFSKEKINKDKKTIVTSFYPMYIATINIVGETDSVTVENLSEPQTGCLHDFQLTPADMKLLSSADAFIVNGGGIESFMKDVAKSYPKLSVIEACRDLSLLSDEEEENAHAWMSISYYRKQVANIAAGLCEIDPNNAAIYEENAKNYDAKLAELEAQQKAVLEKAKEQNIVIFHEAYAYVAADYKMNVVGVMDLDEERQISAGEVAKVLSTIENNNVKIVLAEELYGKDMGDTVSKESEVLVVYINPLNRGKYDKDSYLTGMKDNIKIISEALDKQK